MDTIVQLNTALKARYEIERELGAGGMATVYLARDLKHNRRVALKVLRPDLGVVLGAERFLSEIQVTANLQHPNLLPLFDSGEGGGQLFYVMPYVEGESLRARLNREKQLPVDEAIHIATSVASALDYAHRHGVIHRDLKPENILLHEGQPVVADFGIALAVSNAGGGRITQTGLSLGTPQYMSPEQATGDRVIDARTDIYSLGAVTYEMLTGEAPHIGSTSQAIIARVLTETPRSIRSTRPNVPEHVERAVARALEKLPADRFATAHEFADALAGKILVLPSAATLPRTNAEPAPPPPITWRDTLRQPLTRTLAAALAVALAAWAIREWRGTDIQESRTPVRFIVTLDDSVRWSDSPGSPAAISPDGRLLVFSGRRGAGAARLYVRPLGDLGVRVLPGTENALQPFFSPDGKWIGFYSGTQLKKMPIDGGSAVPLGDVPALQGASWSTSDQIVVATQGHLAVIPASGGKPRLIAPIDSASHEISQRWPLVLPDGKSVLYASWTNDGITKARIGVASLRGGPARVLDVFGTQPLAMLDDRLVYASASGAIMAVAFDARALQPTGTPVPVIDGVTVGPAGPLKGGVSAGGSAVYVTGDVLKVNQIMIAAERAAPRPLLPEVRAYAFPRYSPDGRHLAFAIITDRTDVWIFDLPSGPLRRLTTEGTFNDRPEWTPDSRNVLFRSNRSGRNAIWIQPADGNRSAELLFSSPRAAVDEGVLSANGEYLVVQLDSSTGGTGGHAYYRGMRGDTAVKLIAGGDQGQQVHARLSPDGHWVAYSSNEGGDWQVYVKPFPSLDARYQVSLQEGVQPVWARDGRRLFYLSGGRLLSATLAFGPFMVVKRDTVLENVADSPAAPGSISFYHANYDVAPDGKSFVFLRGVASEARVIVVHDWKYELRSRMSAAKR